MRILEKLELIEEVATKLDELRSIKKIDAILEQFPTAITQYKIDTSLKSYALSRLEGIDDASIIRMAGYELDMDLSKFKSIPNDDDLIPF